MGAVLAAAGVPRASRAQVPPTAPPAASSPPAGAPPTAAARAEAGERFDRGLRLFNAGDDAGALVELLRAYELVPNTVVLFDIGLVYAQMGRAVEAADTLDRVLADPGTLSAERLARARRTRDEQAARIAEVTLAANVDGARVEVDGIEAAATPLSAPLRVPGGTHVIGLVAPGYAPQRKEIAIAGGEKKSLKFELVAMQGRLAHVAIETHLPGAGVFVDGQPAGTTPLAASIAVAPGAHEIELRRAGYATATRAVTLTDGASGEVTLEPAEDPASGAPTGELALDASETLASVTVDGKPRGVYAGAIRLPAGPHRVVVERGGFEPAVRDVTVDAGRATSVRVVLEPTPEFRAQYVSRAQAQRTWSLVGIVGGAMVLGGGVGLVVYDATQRSHWNAQAATLNAAVQLHSGTACDPASRDSGTSEYAQQCLAPLDAALSHVSAADTRDYFAWSAVGVGAAALAVGLVLRLTSDDPGRYGAPRPSAPGAAGALRVVPSFWTTAGGGGATLAGAF